MSAEQLELLPNPDADDLGAFHGPQAGAPETERLAAIAVYPRTGTSRRRVLDAIRAAGDAGRTDEELSIELRLRWRSTAPRRNELLNGGWIVDSHRRRRTTSGATAAVWVLSEAGRRQWRPA
jgi:hypothetical protein